MERRELEDRIRASLQARADDVQPTPELWERVSERTTRRARWQLGGWVLSGAAAVLAIVVGGIVLFGGPRGVQIDPQPDVADTPDRTPVPDGTAGPTIVTTDGETLFLVDPVTGRAVQEFTPRLGDEQPVGIREVAVRPTDEDGQLTVATVVDNEGSFDVEVVVFDTRGERLERRTIAMGADANQLPPDVVWSQDGRFVMWAGMSLQGRTSAGPALWAYDWADRPEGDRQTVEPFPAAGPGAPAALFDGTGVVDLREWTGDPLGQSRLVATTTQDGSFMVELTGAPSDCGQAAGPCPPTFTAQADPLQLPGLAAMDLGTLQSGINLALAVPTGEGGGPAGSVEDATLSLVAEPTDEQAQALDIPSLATGTAAPLDAWLAAADDRVAIGMGPEAHLLTVSGDRAGEVEITSTIDLPEGTLVAGMVPAAASQPSPSEVESATPTEGPVLDPEAVLLEDGLPAHVITYDGQRGQLQLLDRRSGDAVATWPRPEGVEVDAVPAQVVVHPSSTPRDLEVITRWSIGEAEALSRTVVRDGQVEADGALPSELQPANQGPIAELAESAPVFSPTGDWLAWVETPQGADRPVQLRIVPWGDQGPAGNPSTVAVPDDVVRPQELVDWATTADGDVLTLRPPFGPDEPADASGAMIEFRLDGADPRAGEWATVPLPGNLFDAGSYPAGEIQQRYVAFDGGEDVLYGLAEAPESAVPTGAFSFSEGRVVAFGPDSALVQRADGAWQRVQVDDGAASSVTMPDGTVAVLPWPEPG